MHQTKKKSVCLPPNTRSTKVTSRKEAKVSNHKKMHMPRAPSLEEKCVPTTSHKVRSSDMVQSKAKGVKPEKMHLPHASSLKK